LPNVFTRVPGRPVPPLPRWLALPLRIADGFMVATWSRPPTGTLATTWVTPGTLELCVVVAVIGIGLGVLLLAGGSAGWAVVGGLSILFALGAACVAVVGLVQRVSG
jgi:hypothetical protein